MIRRSVHGVAGAAPTGSERFDVCIVGAGPAGSVLGCRLAQLGLRVLLVERSVFPRHHLGESLTPGVQAMLAGIGAEWVLDAVRARDVTAVQRKWGDGPAAPRDAAGWIVDRAAFDAQLLTYAQRLGVEVWQPATWLSHTVHADGGVVARIAHGGEERQVHAALVAMATGRSRGGVEQRRLAPEGPRTLALYAYWHGDVPTEPAIESLEHGWCWGVPIPGLGYNALAFVDAGSISSRRDIEPLYDAMLAQSEVVAPRRGAKRGPVNTTDATPAMAGACIAPGMIAVGDAALALDPLSSSGVQKAMQNALAAAIVVNTLVRAPDRTADAVAYYERLVQRAAAQHARWGSDFYAAGAAAAPLSSFWRARAGTASITPGDVHSFSPSAPPLVHPDQPLMPDPAVQIAPHPCLGETLVIRELALMHPGWDEPVAFVAGHAVAPLFATVRPGDTANDLVTRSGLPRPLARTLVRWMIDRRLLAPADGAARPQHVKLVAS